MMQQKYYGLFWQFFRRLLKDELQKQGFSRFGNSDNFNLPYPSTILHIR